jgi:hypothetical protein
LIVSFMSTMSSQRKDIKYNQASTARGLLELRLERYLSNSAALNNTAKYQSVGNLKFASCYTGGSSALCEAATQPVGFKLIDPIGKEVAGANVDNPVRYNTRGEICTVKSDDCLFEVFAHFTASCPGNVASCVSPSSFNASYVIQQATGVSPFGTGFVFKSFVSSAIPVGAPPYTLTSYSRSHADGSATFSLGVHDFCALSRFVYDGDGVGDCIMNGNKRANWTMTINDEGGAQAQTCGAICVDFL